MRHFKLRRTPQAEDRRGQTERPKAETITISKRLVTRTFERKEGSPNAANPIAAICRPTTLETSMRRCNTLEGEQAGEARGRENPMTK